jgi:hypothetical protein
VRAAGLGGVSDDKVWDRAQVRAELNGRSLRREAIDEHAIRHNDPALWLQIVERYGAWLQLCETPVEYDARQRRASEHGCSSRVLR